MLALCFVLVVIVVLLLLEMPVAFVFGLGSLLLVLLTGRDMSYLAPYAMWQEGSFALIALPLFIVAGSLMGASGISERLIRLINAFVGSIKGGLGAVTVITCALFGAIAGNGSSSIAAIGSIMIPKMVDRGYPPGHATALVACSSVLAMLIPPSVTMIIFAIGGGLSVAMCFLSTIVPALVIMLLYCVINRWQMGKVAELSVEPALSLPERAQQIGVAFKQSFFALLMPGIMLGGIYGGIFTPTEAAAVALVYTLPVGFLIYKGLNVRSMLDAIVSGGMTTGAITTMLFFLFVMSRALVQENIPQQLANFLVSFSDSRWVLLLLMNLLLLVIGMLVDDSAGAILASIILLPVATAAGIDPIHFAAIVGVNLGLGNVTPPCAPLLFMAGSVSGVGLREYIRPTLRFLLLGHLPVVLLVTYVPEIALWLPNLLMGQ